MGRLSDSTIEPSLFTPRQAPPRPRGYPEGIPPEVCNLFEKLALDVHATGFKRYSSDAILHRIRWTFQIDRGEREFKCNDHWTAPLARWFLERHPDMPKFFELRSSQHEGKTP